jgi:uncharacterized protein (TIGR02147 family)
MKGMNSIYDYTDYRTFLRDRFAQLKAKNPSFSYRAFNRMAGVKSSSFLKLVIDGKRNLADDGIRMIAEGFRLSEPDRRYFECLVKFNQADTHEEKDRHFRELVKNKKFLAAKPLTAAQYKLFSHWYYVAFLEMIRIPSDEPRTLAWIQRRINPPVGLRELKKAVRDLKHLDLIEEDPVDGFRRKDSMLTTEDEVKSISVANFHVQMSELAKRAVTEERAKEREFSTLTVVTSEKSFQRAKQEIREFRKKLHSILEQEAEGPKTFVGHLNLQLFKLSKMETIL